MSALAIYQRMLEPGHRPRMAAAGPLPGGAVPRAPVRLRGGLGLPKDRGRGRHGSRLLPEIAELAQMSKWRLSHIEWLQSTDAKLAGIVNVTGRPPPPFGACRRSPLVTHTPHEHPRGHPAITGRSATSSTTSPSRRTDSCRRTGGRRTPRSWSESARPWASSTTRLGPAHGRRGPTGRIPAGVPRSRRPRRASCRSSRSTARTSSCSPATA
jgi:hypothetical protein